MFYTLRCWNKTVIGHAVCVNFKNYNYQVLRLFANDMCTKIGSFFNNETELKDIDHENTDHLFLRRVDIWLTVQRRRAG